MERQQRWLGRFILGVSEQIFLGRGARRRRRRRRRRGVDDDDDDDVVQSVVGCQKTLKLHCTALHCTALQSRDGVEPGVDKIECNTVGIAGIENIGGGVVYTC